MKALFLFLILITAASATQISGNDTRQTRKQVVKDFEARNFAPYRDHFEVISNDALVQKGIIQNISVLENNTSINGINDAVQVINCDVATNENWTATVYNFEPQSGLLSCLVSPVHDLRNPIGIFKIHFPNVASFFKKDLAAAEEHEHDSIIAAKNRFSVIQQEKQNIKDSIIGSDENRLSIPQLILSTLLTDDNIIDVQATKDLNKIQLKAGLSSAITVEDGTTVDNKDYILNDLESVFVNYSKLSDLTMTYLTILIGFLFVFGLGGKAIHAYKTKEKAHAVYFGGMLFAALLFIPYTQSENITDNTNTFQTKYQDFERGGYYIFNDWAQKMSSLIIDTQVDSIIAKSGIGTGDQIINTYAGMKQYSNLIVFNQMTTTYCTDIFDESDALQKTTTLNDGKRPIFSDNSSTVYPTSENWANAEGLYNNIQDYYSYSVNGLNSYTPATKNIYNNLDLPEEDTNRIGVMYYPKYSLAFCGKNYFKTLSDSKTYKEYQNLYNSLVNTGNDQNSKVEMIRELVRFQYSLQRDWGFLGVLGLPITKLQTEMIGNIYHRNTQAIDRLKSKLAKDDKQKLLHSILSSIPYMFVPGASTLYQTTLSTVRDLRSGYEDSALGWILGKAGANIAVTTASNIAAFSMSYLTAKTILAVLPIIAIIAIGILRFIVIMVKIFVLHFSMLFMLPLAFVKDNIDIISKFSLRVLSVMFELPIFVLSVYLAIVANDLVHNVGTLFTKTMILGLINNSNAQHAQDNFTWENLTKLNFQITDTMKIYFIDGFFEVLIALFSIFIIYKILISLHSLIFEQFEIKGTQAMEGAIESIKQDTSSFGGKI